MGLDLYLFQYINGFAGKYAWLDFTGIFFAKYLGYVLLSGLALFFVANALKYLPMIILGLASGLIARFGLVELIRFLLPRTRPFVENHVNLLVDGINQSAFPSGHAAFFFALSTVILLYNKKVYPTSSRRLWWGAGLLFFAGSAIISLARVFVGVHWPSDILVGAAVGIFTGFLVYRNLKFSTT